MKKLLLTFIAFGSLQSYGQIFYQNFESGTIKATYIGSGANQFDWMSSFGNSPSTIETENGNNFLRYNKIAGSSSVINRRTSLNADLSKNVAVVRFKLRVSPPDVEEATPPNNIATIYFGGGNPVPTAFDNDNVNEVPNENVFSSLLLRVRKNSPSSYEFFVSATEHYFAGWQEILYVANKSGGTITYKNPLGVDETVITGRQDVWVGTTRVINDGTINANYTQTTYNQFKIRIPSNWANAKIDIDDFRIDSDVSVLPVSFTSFTGKNDGNVNQLSWSTASEKNNSHFEILRSGDQNNFEVISTVKGNGDTNQSQNYRFTDYNPLIGNNYYKIRQVDFDEKVTENPAIVHVYFGQNNKTFYVARDEKGYINVWLYSSDNKKDQLNISDINGKLLHQQDINLQNGQNLIQIPDNLQKGVYIVNIRKQNLTAKLIK